MHDCGDGTAHRLLDLKRKHWLISMSLITNDKWWSHSTLQGGLRRAGRLAPRQHVHHLERSARCRAHLDQESQLVRAGDRDPQAQERDGNGHRAGCDTKKT